MPNRVVREGIIKSDLVDLLDFAAEVFYRRLMSVADDFGRADGRAAVLRSELYSLRVDKISLEQIEIWKKICAAVGLIQVYRVDGKEYVVIKNFNQRLRAMKSRFPAPPEDCQSSAVVCHTHVSHPLSSAVTGPLESEAEAESETESEGEAEGQTPALFFDKGWMQYPRAETPIELTEMEVNGSIEWIVRLRQLTLTSSRINDFWIAFRLKLRGAKYYATRGDLVMHFREWLKTQKIEDTGSPPKKELSPGEKIRQARQKQNQQ